MDGCIREMKVRMQDLGARLNMRGVEQPLVEGLYDDDTVLLAESEAMLQRIVDEFDSICKRRKLKVNAGKSKVIVFEGAREQTINFISAKHLLLKLAIPMRYAANAAVVSCSLVIKSSRHRLLVLLNFNGTSARLLLRRQQPYLT